MIQDEFFLFQMYMSLMQCIYNLKAGMGVDGGRILSLPKRQVVKVQFIEKYGQYYF